MKKSTAKKLINSSVPVQQRLWFRAKRRLKIPLTELEKQAKKFNIGSFRTARYFIDDISVGRG